MDPLPLFQSPFFTVGRDHRHLVVRLLAEAWVLSTCPVNGGLRRDLTHLVNHQSCEPVKHQERFEFITGKGPVGYHSHVCAELALDPRTTAVLGTAATMQYLGIATRTHADLSVTAIVTAGVTGNAGCAGEPAAYDESGGVWKRTTTEADPKAAGTHGGTINTLLLFSSPLTESALSRAVVTMTEAKTSALFDLAIGSRSSWRPATGTGTDQFAIAAPAAGANVRTWTGHHTKAGELIGLTVREATLESLRWQNGLEPSYTRSLFHALGRFGLTEEHFKARMEALLDAGDHALLKHNWNPVIFEPQLASAAYAYAAVLDRILCGTLGFAAAHEALLNQAALMAAGLAARPAAFPTFRAELAGELSPEDATRGGTLPAPAVELACRAIALGWRSKWRT